ncbi:hypothetical protein [Staphylococcus epidermidis]|uniref:hypothetical protein n=1 Tax=Staphylococcus epidermidis TaxID=1282 RepID=UPI001642665A|nr:hypothetical protein [Staphylococcus epidermidis]
MIKKRIIKEMKRIKNEMKVKMHEMMKLEKRMKIERINVKVSVMVEKEDMKVIGKIVKV